MSLDAALIGYVVRQDALAEIQQAGISKDDFVDEYKHVWNFILKQQRQHSSTPSKKVIKARFGDVDVPNTPNRDIPILLTQMRQRRKYIDLLQAINAAADNLNSYEEVEGVVNDLLGQLNELSARSATQRSHLVDLFDEDNAKRMLKELHKRRSGRLAGFPTGLQKFDQLAGGLVRQKMVIVMGRPGLGKSWLDLLFVATAVMGGEKVILYPLEMTLFETAMRLYTLFSQKMFGVEKVLRNYDLTMGNVKKKDVVRFLHAMEDKFAGQLYVADVASLADPYTTERIEAEVLMHKPSMFWVDYITLLHAGGDDSDSWTGVKRLSNGIKNCAMRQNVVGGCSAQIGREALRVKAFLPRLEHISYGDSIGQDADQAIPINRKKDYLYYALTKNRGGPEFGKTRVRFDPNVGIIEETGDDEDDD